MSEALMRLAIKHARLADEVQRLRKESSSLSCEGYKHEAFGAPQSCLSKAYEENGADNAEAGPYDGYSFEETYAVALSEGRICDKCQRLRELKRQRVKVRVHLGAVRAAITRIGRRLEATQEQGA